MSTATEGWAIAIASVSRALLANTQKTAGGRVTETVTMARPTPQTETRRRAPYLVASSAPGIEATPSINTANEVIEPVTEKLRLSSERIAGSEGGIANRITRRLKAVSQTSPSWMTFRRKSRQIVGTSSRRASARLTSLRNASGRR